MRRLCSRRSSALPSQIRSPRLLPHRTLLGQRKFSTSPTDSQPTNVQQRHTSPPAIFSPAQRDAFTRDGFVALENVLSPDDAAALAEHYAALFAGEFPTGIYPDEWHWREGISLPRAFREIVNGWKSSPLVARVALAPALGRAASELMGWSAGCLLYTSPSPRDGLLSRMPSSA